MYIAKGVIINTYCRPGSNPKPTKTKESETKSIIPNIKTI